MVPFLFVNKTLTMILCGKSVTVKEDHVNYGQIIRS